MKVKNVKVKKLPERRTEWQCGRGGEQYEELHAIVHTADKLPVIHPLSLGVGDVHFSERCNWAMFIFLNDAMFSNS